MLLESRNEKFPIYERWKALFLSSFCGKYSGAVINAPLYVLRLFSSYNSKHELILSRQEAAQVVRLIVRRLDCLKASLGEWYSILAST